MNYAEDRAYRQPQPGSFSPARLFGAGIAAVVVVAITICIPKTFEHVAANELVVIQAPLSGNLTWYKQPGVVWQGFGAVTSYPKQWQFSFSNKDDVGKKNDESVKIRFNEGGHAQVSGTCNVEMPVDDSSLTMLHTKYGSKEAINQQIVRSAVSRSVYMTGPLMSSKESSAERRNELLQDIEDQVQHGIYLTKTLQAKQVDLLSGQERTVSIVQTVKDQSGATARAEQSPLDRYRIRVFNFSIDEVKYDPDVEAQIASQQKMAMDVQTSIVEAKKAEQRAITIEKNGEADAAKAKWEQEVIKAKAVTEAQQHLEVATKEAQAAEQTKQKLILEGQGEGEKRRLVMAADGALDKKLAAQIEIQKTWADAFAKHAGPLVPSYMSGGNGNANGSNAATQFMDLMTAKAARDLGLDMTIPTGKKP